MERKIREYEIKCQIGSGGMGKIYKAVHPALKTYVIIKQLEKKSTREFQERFEREAKIMMSLRHENIVPVYDYFVENNQRYIVMEYIDGMTLAELILDKGKIHPIAAIFIYNEVCKGLDYAHSKDVIHRDLKPSNIMISHAGEVKIIDFGIASSPEKTSNLTETGIVIGTPAYMSPEQLSDLKSVTNKTDIYSMGVILYEMLTGRTPFGSSFSAESISIRLSGNFQNAKRINKDIPHAINKIIQKSLHPKPEKRFKNILIPYRILKKYYQKLNSMTVNANLKEYIKNGGFTQEIRKTKPMYSSFLSSLKISLARKAVIISVFVLAAVVVAFTQLRERWKNKIDPETSGRMVISYHFSMPVWGKIPDKNRFPAHHRHQYLIREKIIHNHLNIYNGFLLRASLYQAGENHVVHDKIQTLTLKPSNYLPVNNEAMYIDNPERFYTLKSKTLVMKKGYYALKIELNSQIHWVFFAVKNLREYSGVQPINAYFRNNERRKVSFHFNFTDSLTGNPVQDIKVEILWGVWTNWNDFMKKKEYVDRLFNGNTYYFRFLHPDYRTANVFKIHAELDQTQVNIDAALVPRTYNIAGR